MNGLERKSRQPSETNDERRTYWYAVEAYEEDWTGVKRDQSE